MKLYPHQEECIRFHLEHHYSLNCCEMGLGKSIIALMVAKTLKTSPIVFGPAFLRTNWLNEAKKVGVGIEFIAYSKITTPTMFDKPRLIIADELHYIKNPYAKRTEHFMDFLKDTKPEYFIGMTGTPIRNRVPDFWTLLACCNYNPKDTSGKKLEGDLKFYKKFSRYFCNSRDIRTPYGYAEKFTSLKEDKIPELKELLKDKYIKFTAEKVLKDLPDMIDKEVMLELSDDPSLSEVFNDYITGSKVDIKGKVNSAKLKAPSTSEYIKDLLEQESGPIVCFTDHIDSGKIISENVKNSVFVSGSMPPHDRALIVDKFQVGKIPCIVATIGSLSVGVTLTAANHIVFNDLSWVPSDNDQAKKRIHRIGQKKLCVAHYMLASETDQYIMNTLNDKLETINKIV